MSVEGEVAACEPGLGWLDGLSGSVQVSFSVRDRGFDIGVAMVRIDAEACD